MRRESSLSLIWRLGLGVFALQVGFATVLGLIAWDQAVSLRREQARSQLRLAAGLLAREYAPLLDPLDEPALAAAMQRHAEISALRFWIVLPDGRTIAPGGGAAAPPPGEDGAIAQDAAAIKSDGRTIGVLRATMALQRIRVRPERPVVLVALAGAGSACGTFALLVMLRRGMRRASRQVALAVARTGAGRHVPAILERPPSEFGPILSALQDMGTRVGERIEQLESSRSEQEALLQSMEAGLIALDREQRILTTNRVAERMLGLSGPEARGMLLQEVVRHAGLNRFVADGLADPARRTGEFEIHGQEPLIVRATSGALRDSTGEQVGVIVLLTDVTHMKRLESMRSDFASNVSHELRTPITNIKGYVETLIEEGLADPELVMRFLRIIARNAERLGAIVDDLLALTSLERIEARESLVTVPTPVRSLVETAGAQLEADRAGKEITILNQVPPGARVMVSPRLAEQALANLISNAIKYSPPRTRVTVRSRPVATPDGSPGMEISVEDEGPGIAQEHLGRIFERFYRVDKARSREQGGTGLGLAIVKHIALAHGGQVSVESTLGRGSTFRLTFLADEHAPPAAGIPAPAE